jgi:transcription elongation factor GreA
MAERAVYLTRDGYTALEQERRELVEVRRPGVVGRLRQALEFEDIMDNPEYRQALEDQAAIEARLTEVERMLADATIITERAGRNFVTLGSRVQVRTGEGDIETYTIVGSAEAEPRRGRVSNESPIGRALIGKRVDARARVLAPSGSFELEVLSIE